MKALILKVSSFRAVMLPQVCLLPLAISDMFVQVTESRCLSLTDRYGLMAAVLQETLTEDERGCVDRLLRQICRGQLKAVFNG